MGYLKKIKKKKWTVEEYIETYFLSDEFGFESYNDSVHTVLFAVNMALEQNGILPNVCLEDGGKGLDALLDVNIAGLEFEFEKEFSVDSDKLN